MQNLPSIVDDLIRSVESIRTDSAKFPEAYMVDLCDQFRANAIKMIFERTGRINSAWVLKYTPDFDKDMQDDSECVKFWVPAPIGISTFQDGIIYAGTLDGKKSFRRVLSAGEFATYSQHRNFDATTEQVLIEGIEGDMLLLKVYGNPLLTEIRTDAIWSKPSKLSTYNYDKDMYPLCDEGITLMKQLIIKSQLSLQEQVPADLKQDEKPNIATPQK